MSQNAPRGIELPANSSRRFDARSSRTTYELVGNALNLKAGLNGRILYLMEIYFYCNSKNDYNTGPSSQLNRENLCKPSCVLYLRQGNKSVKYSSFRVWEGFPKQTKQCLFCKTHRNWNIYLSLGVGPGPETVLHWLMCYGVLVVRPYLSHFRTKVLFQ